MQIEVGTPLAALAAADWDRLAGSDDPFLSYAYFNALEANGASGPGSRFETCHACARDDDGRLVGVMPLYRKNDSWGEFVFDFAWADAYTRAGRDYYPKLVSAVPYTPVGGRRILVADSDTASTVRDALIAGVIDYAREQRVSSWHVLFCQPDEQAALCNAGLLARTDCQFHWFNRGYTDFDHYLSFFRSSRRKNVRRERRRVSEAGIEFETVSGADMSVQDWQDFYGFYANSFMIRGMTPYFAAGVFARLGATAGQRMIVKFARRSDIRIAASLFFVGPDRLYGRYWGASEHHDALHFETCYYQGIEYCIEHGIGQFDPGTQGEHKIARGFRAQPSWSAHWVREPAFRDAIADYLSREHVAIEHYMMQVDEHLPFRRDQSGA